MRRASLVFCMLAGLALQAAPPVVTDGPAMQYVLKNAFMVKWRTADAPGVSSTITCNIPRNFTGTSVTCGVAAGTGSSFPAGSVVRIDHEHLIVTSQSGDILTLTQGYDPEFERVWEGTLSNIKVDATGATCTVNTVEKHPYAVGDTVNVLRQVPANIPGGPFTVASVPTSTSFTFSCPGSTPNSTTNNAGLQVWKYPSAHSSGATIQRIDSTGRVCFGTDTTYSDPNSPANAPTETFTAMQQSVNHFVYVVALQPGTTYHYKIQSTTRSSALPTSCSAPGADTVESADNTVTTPAAVTNDQVPTPPSNNARTWDFTDTASSWNTDVLAAANCSDLQTKVNAAAAQDGNTNNRVRVPPGANCAINLTLPAKNGINPTGSGKLVLEVDTANLAKLPPQGTRLNAAWYGSLLPILYTSNTSPVIFVGPKASYWTVRGLQISTDPNKNSAGFGGDMPLVTSFDGSNNDYDMSVQPSHIAFEQIWVNCPGFNGYCKGPRLHGAYIAVMDSTIQAYGYASDQGGIQFDGFASQYLYAHNNDVSAPMTGYYQSDNSIHDQDSIIDRNYFHKPTSMNPKSADYLMSVVQPIASATAGSTTAFVTTTANDVGGAFSGPNPPVAIKGATGAWAALNATNWSVRAGTLNLTVTSGAATATTSTPHGLTTGQYVYVGGGMGAYCNDFYDYLTPSQVTVTSSTQFTFSLGSSTFSTTHGQACDHSDIAIYGPVFRATQVNPATFTIPVNSTGFGALTGSVTVGYPAVRDVKNAFEFKEGERALITGNIVDGSPSVLQSGQGFTMTVRGLDMFYGWPMAQTVACFACGQTIKDVDIQKNIVRNTCSNVLSVLGANPNSPVIPAYRIRLQGNLGMNQSRLAGNASSCFGALVALQGSYNDITVDHNTAFNDSNVLSETVTGTAWPRSGKIYFTNNIADGANAMSNTSCYWSGMLSGLNKNGCTYSYSDWLWTRNVNYGDAAANGYGGDPWGWFRQYADGVTTGSLASYQANFWPQDHSGVGFAGLITFNACTNTAPIVCTSTAPHGLTANDGFIRVMGATGNTGANGLWPIGPVTTNTVTLAGSIGNGTFTGAASAMPWSGAAATPANAALAPTSPYKAGTAYTAAHCCPPDTTTGAGQATDNTDIGADMGALRAAVGDLSVSGVSSSGSSATFTYTVYAGNGESCYIDTSSDSFNTFTRTTDSGSGTSRTTQVNGLTAGANYSYHLMCPSSSASGSFQAGGGSGGGCAFSISPPSQSYPASGGSTVVSIAATGGPGCAWSVQNAPAWMSFTPSSGTDSGQTTATISANTDVARSASPAIAGQTFSVSEADGCSLSIDPVSQSYPASGGSTLISITASGSGCPWSASNVPAWMSFAPSSGVGSGQTTATAAANPGSARNGSPTIGGQTFAASEAAAQVPVSGGAGFTSAIGASGITVR